MPILLETSGDPERHGPYAPDTQTVLATRSPFWLRVNESWVHLEGVTPGTSRSADRPSSEMVTVDGVRHVQRAPRAPREWSLDFTHATAEAMALLALAAEVDDVWLLDSTATGANMLSPRECYGPATESAVLCGGIPLRAFPNGEAEVEVMVREGQPVEVSVWSDANEGASVATATYPGGFAPVVSPAGSGVRRASGGFTADSDGTATIGVSAPSGAVVSGLQVAEVSPEQLLAVESTRWLAGERMPCMVAVADPERNLERIVNGTGYGSYSVTMREVG